MIALLAGAAHASTRALPSDRVQAFDWTAGGGFGKSEDLPDAAAAASAITGPSGRSLDGSVVTFRWSAGGHVESFRLDVGTPDDPTAYFTGETRARERVVGGLPTDGSPIVARLTSKVGGTYDTFPPHIARYTAATAAPPARGIILPGNHSVLPIYPAGGGRHVGFLHDSDRLTALDAQGHVVWSRESPPGQLFGGFDFNADGWPDAALARSAVRGGESCGKHELFDRWFTFVDGRTGDLVESPVPRLSDRCWTFNGETYPTIAWTTFSILRGAAPGAIAASPYYAEMGHFFEFSDGRLRERGHFLYPSTPLYDRFYPAARPNAFDTGTKHVASSHCANGLLLQHRGEDRLVFFTTARVAQYQFERASPGQLIADHPFVTGPRRKRLGRNYGVVARDPGYPDLLAQVAGSDALTVLNDCIAGEPVTDPWGQIERHVTLYDLRTDALEDRFFSNAHDEQDGHKYQGRIIHPANPWLPTRPGSPSRLVYSVFTDGHWKLHVSAPGRTSDSFTIADRFLWDLRDVDGDGKLEAIVSPAPNGYLPDWTTQVLRWDEDTSTFVEGPTFGGVLPHLAAVFPTGEVTAPRLGLYPVLSAGSRMILRTRSGDLELAPLD